MYEKKVFKKWYGFSINRCDILHYKLLGIYTIGINAKNKDLTELVPVENLIKLTLDSKFETMTDRRPTTGEDLIIDDKLLQIYNNESKFLAKWYEKSNLKIDNYETDVYIVNIKQNSLDTYVVDVLYDVKFHIVGDKQHEISESVDEPFKFEIKNENGEFYVNKFVDYIDDIGTFGENEKNLFKEMDNYLNNYDEKLSLKAKELNSKLENINELYEKV